MTNRLSVLMLRTFLSKPEWLLFTTLFFCCTGCAVFSGIRNMEPVVQMGHACAATCAAFSADGQYLLSGATDGSIKLWEISTGRQIRSFNAQAMVKDVAFSPDQKTALAGYSNGDLIHWELATGRMHRRPKAHKAAVKRVAFTPDGSKTISGDENLTVVVMETTTGRTIRSFSGKKEVLSNIMPTAIAFSNDRRLVLLGNTKNQLYHVESGRNLYDLGQYSPSMRWGNPIVDLAFSPDDRFFVSAGRVMELIETQSGRIIRSFAEIPRGIESVAFSPTGRNVAVSSDLGIAIWDVDSGKRTAILTENTGNLHRVVWSPDGRFVLSTNSDGHLSLWDVTSRRQVRSFTGKLEKVLAADHSPDGRFILTGTDNGNLVLWDFLKGVVTKRFKGHSQKVFCLSFTPDGHHAISGGADQKIRLWDIRDGKSIRTFAGHTADVTCLAVSPDGRMAISGSRDQTCILWDIATGRPLNVFKGHQHWVNSVRFSPDGRTILSAGSDRTWRLWQVATGRQIRSNEDKSGWIHSTAFSPDGRFLFTGSWKTVTIWNVSSGEPVRTFNKHRGNVTDISVSPDGRLAISGGDRQGVKIWETANGQERIDIRGHLDAIRAVGFSLGGRHADTAGDDQTHRIWDVDTGAEIARMVSSNDGEWLIVTPDGYYATSPEGAGLLHWVEDGGMETFTYEQFKSIFNRPQIIQDRLSGKSGAGRPAPTITSPPSVSIPGHQTLSRVARKTYPLEVSAVSDQSLRAIRVFTNGKPAKALPVNAKVVHQTLDIPLYAGLNRITAVAWDEKDFSSNPKYTDIICDYPNLPQTNLYVLSVGVSDYPNLSPTWNLQFAHTDAQALANALDSQQESVFGSVSTKLSVNQMATVKGITGELEALDKIGKNDIAVIFMAGHGVRDENGTFYFLTSDAMMGHPESGGISWDMLGEYLARIKGRVILLLDACHSGSLVRQTIVPNDELAGAFFSGKRNGIMVFSASKGRQYSFESSDIGSGYGIFTYALIQGLTSKSNEADLNNNGYVEFLELVDYVSQYVDHETLGAQTPWLSRKELFGDLPIAAVR